VRRFAKLESLVIVSLLCVAATAQNAGRSQQKRDAVAVVAGQTVYDDELLPLIQGQMFQLRSQEYEIKSKALETLVSQKLLAAEAAKKGMPADKFLALEVDAVVPEPTDAELKALYLAQKEQLGKTFEDYRAPLLRLLKQAKLQEARQEYYRKLREGASVSVLLQKPKLDVAHDPARLRGNPQAPVVILEFADFQCPYCQVAEPTLKKLLAKYEGRVSLSYRDFPLSEIHPNADLAAQAARCAGDQAKFWEYHDSLYEHPDKLHREGLVEQARNLKLDEKQFDSCLSSSKYKGQVEQDRQLGLRAGIAGTPGFVINGNVVSGNRSQEEFEKLIEAELAAAGKQTQGANQTAQSRTRDTSGAHDRRP
jgi:predicted DsbA family dithiol-disulfide isomerase